MHVTFRMYSSNPSSASKVDADLKTDAAAKWTRAGLFFMLLFIALAVEIAMYYHHRVSLRYPREVSFSE